MKRILLVLFFLIFFVLLSTIWIKSDSRRLQSINKTKEEEILFLLPDGVFLRDYQALSDERDSHLAIYLEKGYKFDSWGLSCPGIILGDSIVGKYHLVLIQDARLINDVIIPHAYSEDTIELTYKNYKDGWPTENEVKQKEIIKLLDFKDMTGDSFPYEFLLTTTGGGCGFYDSLVGGYDAEENKAVLFSNWLPRFSPNEKGEYYYLFECGDHGNTTRVEEKYAFDKINKTFKRVWEKQTPCEY